MKSAWLSMCLEVTHAQRYCAKALLTFLTILLVGVHGQSYAAWYQASGQALIVDGDKVTAKQLATKEAIKQALLFAGASVTSIQQLANGLLQDDHLEIRAIGEVNQLELIDEIYHDDYVTVSIRADIFPQQVHCSASTYRKSVVTTLMTINAPQHTQDGKIYALSQAIPNKLPALFAEQSMHLGLQPIVPTRFNWEMSSIQAQAYQLAQDNDAQYVLALSADDLSVHRPESTWAFWQDSGAQRQFKLRARVFDAMSSTVIMDQTYSTQAPWSFDKFTDVDVFSTEFWESPYGKSILQELNNLVAELDEVLSCERSIGRVLQVANNQLQINLGQQHAVKSGDELVVFQTRQLVDTFGQSYRQHVLHPTPVIVQAVFSKTATVAAADGSLLSDIQPNDFVVKL
ncbi:flagella assembly protein FlgT [Alteromonas flava]|uniref:flagella assembly protein FlgT n=1 Tax=Alteromonas flava TaxID=2048003 RepID=UPI001F0C69B6|nr:flagella assembly protein FlgT [Alteromonas flava]